MLFTDYICAANPLLRKWNTSLVDKEKDLLISFQERAGKSIIGGKIVLEEMRSQNVGFSITRMISNKDERITLPYFPDVLNEKIYDQSGNMLEYSHGIWGNFQFNTSVQETILNLQFQTKNGT